MTRQVASNSRVVRSTRSVASLQKAFLAIILVVIAMALFNLNPEHEDGVLHRGQFHRSREVEFDLPHPGDGGDVRRSPEVSISIGG